MTGIVWTVEIIVAFRELHANKAGLSFSEIAAKLSAAFNIELSRNACIGKARRLGLPMRDATPRKPPKREKKMRVRVDAPIPPRIRNRTIGPGIDILQLNHSNCHWPLGGVEDHPPYLYCGNPAEFDRPYCYDHCKKAYNSPTRQWQ
jgi:GcrA cell cycle regulator